jgi:mRNA-degrading endonuclease RelE of RelBE toxin-antitoxin system
MLKGMDALSFSLDLSRDAKKILDKLDLKAAKKIISHLQEIQKEPFRSRPTADIIKIRGRNPPAYRLRIGNIRIEYLVHEDTKLVYISRIFKRSGDSDYR